MDTSPIQAMGSLRHKVRGQVDVNEDQDHWHYQHPLVISYPGSTGLLRCTLPFKGWVPIRAAR